MELREKIIDAINGAWDDEDDGKTVRAAADAILDIPEIRDALAFRDSSKSLTKAAMGEGCYEKRGDFMVWVRDGDEAIEQPQADY